MVAMFIVRIIRFSSPCSTLTNSAHEYQGEIGVLDRRDMDHFADIFLDFQKLGECHGESKLPHLLTLLQNPMILCSQARSNSKKN